MTWYEDEVKNLEALRSTLDYEPEMIFYGSSSIRLWKTLYNDFGPYRPVNLGFGGSTLAACVWFFDRILHDYKPRQIVCYAGDNDLGDGRSPEEVFIFFQQLIAHLDKKFPGIPFSYISIKPSLAREAIMGQIRYANELISDAISNMDDHYHFVNIFDSMLDVHGHPRASLYEPDGLHLSEQGYAVWKEVLLHHVDRIFKKA